MKREPGTELLTKHGSGIVTDGLAVWVDFRDAPYDKVMTGGSDISIRSAKINDRVSGQVVSMQQSQWTAEMEHDAQNGILRITQRYSGGNGQIEMSVVQSRVVMATEITANLRNCTWTFLARVNDSLALLRAHNGDYFAPQMVNYYGNGRSLSELPDAIAHYAFVREDATHFTMYLNGAAYSTYTHSSTPADFNSNMLLRARSRYVNDNNYYRRNDPAYASTVTTDYHFDVGSIRVYTRPLTADEVARNTRYEIETGRLTV